MTLRAVVRDGLIVINTHGQIPDGTPVEVLPIRKRAASRTGGRRGSRNGKGSSAPEFGFGTWSHRTDIKDAAVFARRLRSKVSRRPRRG